MIARFAKCTVAALAVVLVSATTVFAQVDRATLTGVVRDASDAVLPNAKVTVTSLATGVSSSVTTTDSGAYLVVNLMLLLGWYQWAIFGDPFQSTYGTKSLPHGGVPTPSGFAELLVGTRGFVVYTPFVLVALGGMVGLTRRRSAVRADAWVGLAIALAFVVLISGWRNAWGGDEPGPRYLVPALPFLAVGAAEAWRWVLARPRWLPYVRVAAIWSVANMVGPLLTPHLIPHGTTLVRAWASRLGHGEVVPTLWTMWLGPLGWIPHLLLVALAFALVVHTLRVASSGSGASARRPTPA
jgi:hypothetical protein